MPSSGPPHATDIDPVHAAELLVAACEGCDESLRSLVVLCEPHVRRQARRHAWRRDQVDDVVQDVWVQLLGNARQIRDPQTLIAWLSTVTRHVALRVGGRDARSIAQDIEDSTPGSNSAEEDAIARWSREEVAAGVGQALDRLDGAERTLLLLLHRDDRPGYAAIGREVNRPVGSLGPSRQRLLHRLRTDRDISRLESLVTAA
jgi:RNA polymerase sigma factor (sigma-70 family)